MLAAFVAGAVLGIGVTSGPSEAPKTVTVHLVRRCAQERDCLRPNVVRRMKDEASKVWSLFDVRIDWIDSVDAATSAVDVTVFLEESGEPTPHWVPKRGVVLAALHFPDTPCGTGLARVWATQARRYALLIPGVHLPSLPEAFYDLLLSRALGRALAHEIGHYLLRASRHTARGLMRATFSPLELLEPVTRQRYGLDMANRDALRSCRPGTPGTAGMAGGSSR